MDQNRACDWLSAGSELKAYLACRRLRYGLHFWRTHDGAEVDFLCEASNGWVGMKVKASTAWRNSFNRGLARLGGPLGNLAAYGNHLGTRPGRFGPVAVLPVRDFLAQLWSGGVIA